MQINIFRNNIKIATVKPNNNSELSQKAQSEDVIRLNFELVTYVDLQIGDYIIFNKTSSKYTLNKRPSITEEPNNYQYSCIFEGYLHELRKTKAFLTTPKVGGGVYLDYKYPLSGNASTFLDFIVDNLNRNGGNYVAGVAKETETLNVEFNNFNCYEAIVNLAEKLGFEWYLNGNTLNFDAYDNNTAYIFQVGRKKGLLSLTRSRVDSENVETVVYGFGAMTNMPPRTGDGQTYDSLLLTENRLYFDTESKVSNNTDKYGIIESVQEFDVYPQRTGSVTATTASERTFIDSSIDFDINAQLLAGIQPKIIFLDGKLIGLTFNISYTHATKSITVDYYSDESGEYPNSVIFASVGDTYKLFDIIMPSVYIDNAEVLLKSTTNDYLSKQSNDLELYEAVVDDEFMQFNNISLYLGDKIRVISNALNIDNLYDIKELVNSITEPWKYSIKFGDVLPKSLVAKLTYENFKTSQSIYNVQKNSVTNNSVTNIVGETSNWEEL